MRHKNGVEPSRCKAGVAAMGLLPALAFLCVHAAAADPGPGANYLGINIGGSLDWEGNIVFANAMKSAREWCTPDNTWTPLPAASLDSLGWPTVDAELIVWHGLTRNNSGTYALSLESQGQTSVMVRLAAGNVQNVAYNPATHITTASVVLTDPSDNALCLRFTNTNGGVRNVKLMRPIEPGSATPQPFAEEFSRPFLRAVAPFQALRFMDFMATYSNQQAAWTDRVRPDFASFNRSDSGYSWLGKGAAWEYVIKLCNAAQKDAWICVPLHANDDYIRHLARLFRDGDAFTGNVGLDPALNLYVEYANEVWNTAGQFDGSPNHQLAVQEQAAGDPYRYAFDGNGNDWYWAWRRVARRALDISRIFRQEFGDAAMMTRVRPVFEWQLGYTDVGLDPLNYLEDAYIPLVDPGKPVSHFFYGGGGSAYYSPDNQSDTLSLDNIWNSEAMDADAWGNSVIRTDAAVCATFGLHRIAYEGGPGLDNTGHSESVKAAAWADTRMGTALLQHHAAWSEWGGDLLTYYTLRPNDYQWGFFTAIDDLSLPKYQAVVSLSTAPRTPIAHFKPVPGSTPGIQFDLAVPSWKDSSHSWYATLQDGEWRSYVYSVQSGGTYGVSAAYSNGSGGQAALISDGNLRATQTATGSGTIAASVSWEKGIHSIRLKSSGGSLTVAYVILTYLGPLGVNAQGTVPPTYSLSRNYPNPFNPSTTMRLAVTNAGTVSLKVFDLLGREVRTLVEGLCQPGVYDAVWDGRDFRGTPVASGIYFCRLTAGSGRPRVIRMMLVR